MVWDGVDRERSNDPPYGREPGYETQQKRGQHRGHDDVSDHASTDFDDDGERTMDNDLSVTITDPTDSHATATDSVETSQPPPDPIEDRPYIEIRPEETPLDPAAIDQAMNLLFTLLRDTTQTGLWNKLRGTTQIPIIEWLLVSDGREDASVRYLVGSNYDDLMEDFDGVLRICFPNTYEFRHVQFHPRRIEEHVPYIIPTDDPPANPAERTGLHHPGITPEYPYAAGVEYLGTADRRHDWQIPLQPYTEFTTPTTARTEFSRDDRHETRRVPLASVIETMCAATVPVLVQTVIRPHEDWSRQANSYLQQLNEGVVSTGDAIWEFLAPRDHEERQRYMPPPADRERIEGITSRSPNRTFCVSTRAVALTRTDPRRADDVARRLSNVFGPISGRFHELIGRVATDDELYPKIGPPPGSAIYRDLCTRAAYPAMYHRFGDRLRRRPHESRGIVVDPTELPSLCLLDGGGLTPTGRRAVSIRPAERTGLPLPPPEQLARYRPPGMALGMPLTIDRQPYGHPFTLPARLQDRHLITVGDTGSGKTVQLLTAMLTNVAATDGPDILFDYKGEGTAEEYLRAHYAAYGSFDDVQYFDLTQFLPALSVLDIEPLLAAGIPREEARSRKAGHYEEMLEGVMGTGRYRRAVESPRAVRNHLRALYDPIHGSDAVSHADLYGALQRTLAQREPPPVSEDRFTEYFAGLLERDRDVFNQVLGGAVSRVGSIATDGRLAPIFDHVPSTTGNGPQFSFTELIDEDAVVIFDFGGMETSAKRTLTLAILSDLWMALKARVEDPETTPSAQDELSLVNVYLDDAKDVAETKLVDTLLAQGRSFGLSVMLGVQYPEQLDSPDPGNDTYREALNETATVIAGKVSVDRDLASVLATADIPTNEIEHRLATMRRGEWLFRPGADFGEHTPRPFLMESLPAPPGHPASDEPLTDKAEAAFEAALDQVVERTVSTAGLPYDGPATVDQEENASDDPADEEGSPSFTRVDTFLPYTERLPEPVHYDGDRHALRCVACDNRYDPTVDGMVRAIECCHTLDDVDRDDIPVLDSYLKLSPEERAAESLSDRQFLFLQAVYNAQQRRYDPLEYDITRDSMLRLEEYVGIDHVALQELLDRDLLRHDTDHPHRLYSVSPDGRSIIGESYRRGVDYGHGKGDLEESSEHVLGVIIGERWVKKAFIDNPDSSAVTLSPYHELDIEVEIDTDAEAEADTEVDADTEPPPKTGSETRGDEDGSNKEQQHAREESRRLDIAALDAEGNVVVAVEVERINNDYRKAIPADYDKMAACDPEEAIWIVTRQRDSHAILTTLNDPPDGRPRVEKTYAATTPPQQFLIEAPGLTAMYPVEYIRDTLLGTEDDSESAE